MNLVTALFGWLIRLVLVAAALVLIVGLVAVATLALVASLVWSLITGRPHPVRVVWQRMHQARQGVWQGATRYGAGRSPGRAPPGDVVDAEVREIPEHKGPPSQG